MVNTSIVAVILAALSAAPASAFAPAWTGQARRAASAVTMSAESSADGQQLRVGRREAVSGAVAAAGALALTGPARAEGETFDVTFDIVNEDGTGGAVVIEVHPE